MNKAGQTKPRAVVNVKSTCIHLSDRYGPKPWVIIAPPKLHTLDIKAPSGD